MAQKFSRLFTLTRLQRRTLLTTWFMIPGVAISVRIWGMQRVQDRLSRWLPKPAVNTNEEQFLSHLYAYKRGLRHAPYNGNCLSQSLTLLWLTRRAGFSTDLRIGVRIEDHVFKAHAWVEHKDTPINDRVDVSQRYKAFDKKFVPTHWI